MKTRRFPLLVLLVGLLLTIVGLVLPIIFIRTGGAATGIIGSADAPTYWYIVRKALGGFPLWLDLMGAAMILTSLPAVFFIKTFQRVCSLKTSGITVGLSAVGGLGLMCAIICFLLGSLDFSRYDPYYFILYLIGLFSCFGFIALICLYFEARGKKPSILGFIYDLITSILYLPVFFFLSTLILALF
jgi:hypothetical protein